MTMNDLTDSDFEVDSGFSAADVEGLARAPLRITFQTCLELARGPLKITFQTRLELARAPLRIIFQTCLELARGTVEKNLPSLSTAHALLLLQDVQWSRHNLTNITQLKVLRPVTWLVLSTQESKHEQL